MKNGIAASALLEHWEWVTGIAALLAGIIPAVFKSLDLDKDLAAITRYANTFKALQDRYRQAWRIGSLGDFDAFKKGIRRAHDETRRSAEREHPATRKVLQEGAEKIQEGHYDFEADAS